MMYYLRHFRRKAQRSANRLDYYSAMRTFEACVTHGLQARRSKNRIPETLDAACNCLIMAELVLNTSSDHNWRSEAGRKKVEMKALIDDLKNQRKPEIYRY